MRLPTLLLILAAIVLAAFFLGRQRALSLARPVGGARSLHSLPKYYGYYAALGALGVPPGSADDNGRLFYVTEAGIFALTTPINGEPVSYANGGTIRLATDSGEQLVAWHDAGVAAGGTSCEDPPGVRDLGFAKLNLAYLRDPDGNKLCALHRMP